MNEEAVVYREEVVTIMMLLGDIRADFARSSSSSRRAMAKRKRTPEEIGSRRESDRRSEETLRRLRELVERGWDELEERAAREGRELRIPRPR